MLGIIERALKENHKKPKYKRQKTKTESVLCLLYKMQLKQNKIKLQLKQNKPYKIGLNIKQEQVLDGFEWALKMGSYQLLKHVGEDIIKGSATNSGMKTIKGLGCSRSNFGKGINQGFSVKRKQFL